MCNVRFSLTRKNLVFQKHYMSKGVVEDGLSAREHGGDSRANRKAEIEEADDSSSRNEGVGFALAFSWK